MVPESKSRQSYLKISTLASLKVMNTNLKLTFKDLCVKTKLRQFGAKLNSHQTYLKICTLVNLKMLNTNLVLVSAEIYF